MLGGNAPLLITYGRALLAYIVSYSVLYGFTQWLEDGHGLGAGQAGLIMLPMFATAIAVAALAERREALRAKLVVAAVGQLVACSLLLTLHPASPVWLLVALVLILGVLQGLNSIALQSAVYRQAEPENIAASAGLLRTFGYLGAIVSSAAQGGFYGERADTGGLHHLALLLVAVAAIFLILNVADRSLTRPGRRSHGTESQIPREVDSNA